MSTALLLLFDSKFRFKYPSAASGLLLRSSVISRQFIGSCRTVTKLAETGETVIVCSSPRPVLGHENGPRVLQSTPVIIYQFYQIILRPANAFTSPGFVLGVDRLFFLFGKELVSLWQYFLTAGQVLFQAMPGFYGFCGVFIGFRRNFSESVDGENI